MSVVKYCLLLTSLFLFAGCTMTGATYESQLYNVREIENSLRASLAVGEFTRSESEKVVDPWSFRGATKVASPVGDGYHDLIAKGIEDDLMLARRLDSKSNLVLTGDLTEHLVDASSMSTGEGVVGMTFTLSDSGKVVYLKPVRIVHEWDSSFLGQTAANNAMRAHVEMIERLIASLFQDREFLGAANGNGGSSDE
ncbi:hypothetical protein N9S00_00750 [Luminiphilus sp.]|nr:hypothetical protein [Luminiphilus sp.]